MRFDIFFHIFTKFTFSTVFLHRPSFQVFSSSSLCVSARNLNKCNNYEMKNWNKKCFGIDVVARLYWIWEWKSHGPTAHGIVKSSLRGGHHSGLHSGLRPPFRPSWCPPLREDFPIPRAFGPWDFYNQMVHFSDGSGRQRGDLRGRTQPPDRLPRLPAARLETKQPLRGTTLHIWIWPPFVQIRCCNISPARPIKILKLHHYTQHSFYMFWL